MRSESTPGWLLALAQTPSSLYVLTASRGRATGAVLVSWVQQVSFEPPLVSVAIPRGRGIAPLIRDSRSFALCQVHPDDRLLPRRVRLTDDRDWTALDTIPFETLRTGSPCITQAMAALDCKVLRHMDVEADHELYIGQVVAGKVYTKDRCMLKPDVRSSGRFDLLHRLRPDQINRGSADGGRAIDDDLNGRINGAGANGETPLRETPADEFDAS